MSEKNPSVEVPKPSAAASAATEAAKKVKDVKPPKRLFANPAFQAMGIPAMRLPSRNWVIFWMTVTAAVGGFGYDKYQQKQIISKYADMMKPMAEKTMDTKTVPRKITVFIAPPPSDYLETSLKMWRRYIKPVLFYAGLDYDIVQEDRQGVIRTEVANRMRALRKEYIEEPKIEAPPVTPTDKNAELTPAQVKELGKEYKNNFDWRDAIGIFYKKDKPAEINSEDLESGDLSLSGGVICLGRGAYKEYLAGLHEGLLGPVDPPVIPEEPKQAEDAAKKLTPHEEEVEKEIKVMEEQLEETNEGPLDTEEKPTEEKEEKKEENTGVLARFIDPSEYEAAPFPPLELHSQGSVIHDKQTKLPILVNQPLLVVSVPNLIGFLAIPQRIYRFYRKRYMTEDICSDVAALVESSSLRPFDAATDVNLAKEEESDWPSSWVKQGRKRDSEWTRDVVTDPRITSLMRVCNKPVPASPEADQTANSE